MRADEFHRWLLEADELNPVARTVITHRADIGVTPMDCLAIAAMPVIEPSMPSPAAPWRIYAIESAGRCMPRP
jgi:hypothetical protein